MTQLSTAIVPVSRAVANLARVVNVEPGEIIEPLKKQIMPNATDAELVAFCMIATKYGLDPFMRQVYAIRKDGNGAYQPYISVDGWYAMVERHPQNDGVEFEEHRDAEGKLVSVTCRMYRKDRSRPVTVTEYTKECRRDTKPWRECETRMTRHRAFVQAARICYAITDFGDPDDEGSSSARTGANAAAALNAAISDAADGSADSIAPGPPPPPPEPAPQPVQPKPAEPAVVEAEVVEDDAEEKANALADRLVAANAEVGVTTDRKTILARAKKESKKVGKSVGEWLADRVAKAEAALGSSAQNGA